MALTTQEAENLFRARKLAVQSAIVDFPTHGEKLTLELETEDGRFKFQADINRKNTKSPDKVTYQNRYNKCYTIRRLDFGGGHQNPPGPAPDEIFSGYENALILEPHIHFYFENYDARWALPLRELTELGINFERDDWYTIMERFFTYCSIESYQIQRILFT
jgi:hypothetical protein